MNIMMINVDGKQISDILAFLAKRGVLAEDCALAERYLSGEAGDEVLDQFQRIDFTASAVAFENVRVECAMIMKGLGKAERRQVCIRFFDVLFAIGHSTCHVLLSDNIIDDLMHAEGCEQYKAAAVYIEGAVDYKGYLRTYHIDHLIGVVRSDPEKFRKSIDQLRAEDRRYFLSAVAVYFCTKYGIIKPLQEEDAALMKAYEEGLLSCLDEWLEQQCCSEHDRIVAAICEHQLEKRLLESIRQCHFTVPERKQLCFIGGMAYLNFPLSDVLRDVARTCLAIDTEWVLFTFADVSVGTLDASRKISSKGGDYDELFWIDPETYIRWAAVMGYTRILKRQLAKNQEIYLKAMEEDGFQVMITKKQQAALSGGALSPVNALRELLKKENPGLYGQVGAEKPNYERIIQNLVPDSPHADMAREYLRGNRRISELYPYAEEFEWDYVSNAYLEEEKRHCNDPDFFDRCRAFTVLARSEYTRVVGRDEEKLSGVERFFQALDKEQMDVAHQLAGFVTAYRVYDGMRGCSAETLMEGAVNTFTRYLNERREETIDAFSHAKAEGRHLGLLVMRKDTAQYKSEILSYASDSSKLVRDELLDILYAQQDWLDEIEKLLDAKKAAPRELAVMVLTHWQQEGGDHNEVLLRAMEKEKNAKIMNLLQDALNIQKGGQPKEIFTQEELVKQLHKGNKKKSLAWAYESTVSYEKPFPTVHMTNGEEASEEYLRAVLLCYVSQDKCGINRNAKFLAEELDAAEFARYMDELFDRWLAAGAESRKRWVLYAASIHGGEGIIQKMQHQIQEWPQAARGAIASEAVKALALNPSPHALLFVDGIARKFKFRQVKAAAGEALEFAARELGITREELSDRIVPDLGFDENMQRIFDYGDRTFKVMITSALDIEVYDENGKKLKSLPVPGKKDDQEKAAAAYEAFKQMKKQMKTAVSSQKERLEYALSVKREWAVDAWKALFVRNPLMHQFAIGLVWGVYEEDRLVQSFRYMEDGSFNTQDEEEYELPREARISLVHPLELSDGEKAAWKEQLADYEIKQPIEQLDRTVYHMTEKEADSKCLERFGGCIMNGLSLNGKLTGAGWYRGSVQDAGCFSTYYREDTELGIGVELDFSGTYIGGLDEDVTIYEIWFYKAGSITRGSYMYDEVDEEKAYSLKEVPPRYFSEIVLQLAKVTASSEERDKDWKK